HELTSQGLRLRHCHKVLTTHFLKPRQEGQIESQHPYGGSGHFVDEMHKRAHPRALHRIVRCEGLIWRNLVEVLDDDRRIDDDCAVVIERGHDPVGIKFKIFGLELVAIEEIQLHFIEWQLFPIENKTDSLAARRLRCVVELEPHLELPIALLNSALIHSDDATE